MEIRETHVTKADLKSARLFFDVVRGFFDQKNVVALDMFARNGELTVSSYYRDVFEFDAWELSEEHRAALAMFRPRYMRIGCSYESMTQVLHRYGMIVIDTPQGVHQSADGAEHFEHFDVLEQCPKLLEDRALVVLYVNQRPYDKTEIGEHGYDKYEGYDYLKWMKARAEFYGVPNPSCLSVSDALNAYTSLFDRKGFRTTNVIVVPCFSDVDGREPYAFRLGLEVCKR